MTRALKKNIRRSITGSLGRFIAIMLIILLGCAFFTGLKLARPVMMASQIQYLQNTKLYDLRLLSSIAFDDDAVAAVAEIDGVEVAAASVYADFIWERDGEEQVYHAIALTEGVNEPDLVAGRLPEAANECLVDSEKFTEDVIGTTINLTVSNSDDTLESFSYTEYTIVGLARTPIYLDVSRGTTSLASGSVTGFVIIPLEGFTSEYATEIYIRHTGTYEPYSDEYSDMIDAFSDTVEEEAELILRDWLARLIVITEEKILDGERELEEGRAEGLAELADAWEQLEDARIQLEDAWEQLEDARLQLEDAAAQLDEAAAQLDSTAESWEAALKSARLALNEGQSLLDEAMIDAQSQLTDARTQLEELEETYASGYAEYTAGLAEYEAGLAQWQEGYDEYAEGLSEYQQTLAIYQLAQSAYDQACAEYETNKSVLSEDAVTQLESTIASTGAYLEELKVQLDDANAQLSEAEAQLTASKAVLDDAKAQLDDAAEQLAVLRAALDSGWLEYHAGLAQLLAEQTAQQAEINSARASLDELDYGIESYYEGLAEYESAVLEYQDGLQEYQEGLQEYYDGVAEFEEEIADAEAEIADAWEALEELKETDSTVLYVLTRSANSGYVTFESDSQIVENLSSVFPLFFFLIAALVCSTTMTRMVDDDRTQIGLLRALGYSRGAILTKYAFYAGSAATIGCVLGYFVGGIVFPLVIWTAYGMLYNSSGFVSVYDYGLLGLCLLASLLCSVGTTYLACSRAMQSTSADLIRPRTPAAGKRIFLERVTPLWSRLKFLHKVTLRNIFRFKKRMFMMILGIAGCTALVLTGFGIQDSVADIGNYQFEDIMRYDLAVSTSDALTEETGQQLLTLCGSYLEASALVQMTSGELTGADATKTVYYIATDDENLTDVIDLHLNGESVSMPDLGEVLLTEKLATMAGVSVGDTVTLSTADNTRGTAVVAGLVENYVQYYIYMSGETYTMVFGEAFEPSTLLICLTEDVSSYSVAATLSNADGVSSVSVVQDTRTMIDNMMVSLNYVVALVLFSAGALAFIVLFNLGNINISERQREIATIKVLGFHSRETGAYVFRENLILSIMGIVVGIPVGFFFHSFVMAQIKVDMVAFKVVIKPLSVVLTVLLVLSFTLITDLILRRKIHKIDMAESLKSVE